MAGYSIIIVRHGKLIVAECHQQATVIGILLTTPIYIRRWWTYIKLEFHDADTDTDTDTDILARILADTSDARFPEVIPVAS